MLLQGHISFIVILVLLNFLSSFVRADKCDSGFGYELVQQRLDSIETRLLEKCSNVIESCLDIAQNASGIYKIKPSFSAKSFPVYCDMSAMAGGWIVVQFRYNGVVNFTKTWQEYRDGFGILAAEYWLGLERLHQMTTNDPYELIVYIKTSSGDYAYAHYSEFRIDSEEEKYKLLKLGSYSGTAGDHLRYHEGKPFSTSNGCAMSYKGGWWYGKCFHSNLNGQYTKNDTFGLIWGSAYPPTNFSKMMIRKK